MRYFLLFTLLIRNLSLDGRTQYSVKTKGNNSDLHLLDYLIKVVNIAAIAVPRPEFSRTVLMRQTTAEQCLQATLQSWCQ